MSSTSASSTSRSTSSSTTTIPTSLDYTYQDDEILPASNADLLNAMTTQDVSDVAIDDGDYFIEFGAEYVVKEFKYKHINNTDNINIVWRGRSTLSTQTNPMLLQIYNNNTTTWETLDRETRYPADVDFEMKHTITSNLSNYYDSNNWIVTRIYQQVN